MKNLFPIAMAACLLSLSSFTTADSKTPTTPVVKEAKRAFIWPITGNATGKFGASIKYSISGFDTAPSSITFTTLSGTLIGTYSFSYQSTNTYKAVGMYDDTYINAVYFRISNSCTPGYCIELFSDAR